MQSNNDNNNKNNILFVHKLGTLGLLMFFAFLLYIVFVSHDISIFYWSAACLFCFDIFFLTVFPQVHSLQQNLVELEKLFFQLNGQHYTLTTYHSEASKKAYKKIFFCSAFVKIFFNFLIVLYAIFYDNMEHSTISEMSQQDKYWVPFIYVTCTFIINKSYDFFKSEIIRKQNSASAENTKMLYRSLFFYGVRSFKALLLCCIFSFHTNSDNNAHWLIHSFFVGAFMLFEIFISYLNVCLKECLAKKNKYPFELTKCLRKDLSQTIKILKFVILHEKLYFSVLGGWFLFFAYVLPNFVENKAFNWLCLLSELLTLQQTLC